MNSKITGIALLGALLVAAPCFAQPNNDPATEPDVAANLPDDFARMPAMVPVDDRAVSMLPGRYGESVTLNVPEMGSIKVTLTEYSLFDVSVSLEKAVNAHGGSFTKLRGWGFLNVDEDGNGGDTLLVVLYPEAMATALSGRGETTRGLAGNLAGEDAGDDDALTAEVIEAFTEQPIEMVIRADGVELVVTCPTILGQILDAGEEALERIAQFGRDLGHGIVRVVQTTLGIAIIFGYAIAHHAAELFRSAARVLKRVFVEIGKGAKHVFVDILAQKVIVDTLAKKVFRDIIAKKVFRDIIGKTVFRDVIGKKVFRDAVYGKFLRDWIWRGGIRRVGRFFAREFGGRTKRVETTYGAPTVESRETEGDEGEGLPGGPGR